MQSCAEFDSIGTYHYKAAHCFRESYAWLDKAENAGQAPKATADKS